jgi:hypothetical protein
MRLNVLLSFLALTSTLIAFGGETWRKNDEPLFSRITVRGWISLSCLFLTFGLGVLKEIRAARTSASKDAELSRTQHRLEATQQTLDRRVTDLSNVNFIQLEAAFHALASISRTYFHGLTNLSGALSQSVVDYRGDSLVLYAGDAVSAVLDTKRSNAPIVGLRIGEETYHLNNSDAAGFVQPTQFAVRGRHSEGMSIAIYNPEKATGSIKWLVTSTTTIRQDADFKRVLAGADVPDRIKSMYMVVGTQESVITATPSDRATVVERPEPGFLVKRILSTDRWTEIEMPGGGLGWILSSALSDLR